MKITILILKIVLVTSFTLLCLILIKNAKQTNYKPVEVSIELNSNETEERCMVFYALSGGFHGSQSVSRLYSSGDSLHEIGFSLPALHVRQIRIDPGLRATRYEIGKISFRVGNQVKTYTGEEILHHFELASLVADSLPGNGSLTLLTSGSADGQLIFRHRIDRIFDTVDQTKTLWWQILFIITVYLFVASGIVLYGARILSGILKIHLKMAEFVFKSRVISPTRYSVAVVILFLIKWFLVSSQPMTALTHFNIDDALFVKLAGSLSSGKWLGPYDSLTLAKGFVFPLFLAGCHVVGLSLFFAQTLLLGFASHLMVKALSPLVNGAGWRIFIFAVLLFNPATSDACNTRILRDSLYVSLSVMALAAFIAFWLRRDFGYKNIFRWSVFAGFVLFLHQNTREEAVLFLPFFGLLSMLSLVLMLKNKNHGFFKPVISLKHPLKSEVGMIVLPFLILIAGNVAISSINYSVYGGFVRNETKTEAFSGALAALTKIESKTWIIDVPVTLEARKKAYQVSPAFASLREFMEGEGNGFLKYRPADTNEIIGAFLPWALRYAAQSAGYHQSLPKSQAFYKQVAIEINQAFTDGRLQKRSNFSVFGFSWDHRFLEPTLLKLKEILFFVTAFKGYSPYPLTSFGELSDIARFQQITSEEATFGEFIPESQTFISKIKFKTLITIARIYSMANLVIFVIAFVFYIGLTVMIFFKNTRSKMLVSWIVSTIFLLIVFVRMFLIAFISVSQWDAVNMLYLAPSYPFLLLFEVVTISAAILFATSRKKILKFA